jgi:murein DD-endopeptidase MepM/ murein hydrolase activator NlpD
MTHQRSKKFAVLKRTLFLTTFACLFVCAVYLIKAHTERAEASESFRSTLWLLQQQTAPQPFLYPPYYGTVGLNSVFDHEYPRYELEADLGGSTVDTVHYDGRRVTGPGYSGHNGIDYDVDFSRVLAAASGEVREAGWASAQNADSRYPAFIRDR